MSTEKTYVVSVSRILSRIDEILKQTIKMDGVWVQGEISNLTKHRSGIYYFSLKDEQSQIRCVMFQSYVKLLKFDVQEGAKVSVQADVQLYKTQGNLQLYVKQMRPVGLGELYLELKEREKRLRQQGFFDESHKKPKPEPIEDIGIITAKEGAAYQDVLKTLRQRWPMMKTTLYPALVQGVHAPASIIEQLKTADANRHDAILLVRGGGSFEDLFCFNDEELIKTIYQCQTYIVSGVGHETDTTLTDLVSDHRAVTPTAAAQWVSLDQQEIRRHIRQNRQQMMIQVRKLFTQQRTQLSAYQNHPYLKEPKAWMVDKRLKLDNMETQMDQAYQKILSGRPQIQYYRNQLEQSIGQQIHNQKTKKESLQQQLLIHIQNQYQNNKNRLGKYAALLDAYSPLKTMGRGYTITRHKNHLVTSIHQVQTGETIQTMVKDGIITSNVIKKEKEHE